MDVQDHWQLNGQIDFLNHGSFGAAPRVVLQQHRQLINALERDPVKFLGPERDLIPRLDTVRASLAKFVGAEPTSIAFVRNATDGVNAVVRSFPFNEGDEAIVTDHGYNACNNAVRFATQRAGARLRVARVPFPIKDENEVLQAIQRELSPQTRLLVIDHVTSPTALVFPLKQIIDLAKSNGVRVLVDGAHAPGMVPVDLVQLGADYYTANHHKWLCAPKASGFLFVDPKWQNEVRPTVISHGANRDVPGRSRFLAEFDWVGTYDPTPILTVPTAIEFLRSLRPGGTSVLMHENRQQALAAQTILAKALNIEAPAPTSMIGSMVTIPLPDVHDRYGNDPDLLQQQIYNQYQFELPIFLGPDRQWLLRVSLQAYNTVGQIERLSECLAKEILLDPLQT